MFQPQQRDFLLLVSSGVVNSLGSTVLSIALPYYVYTLTGLALAAGAAFAVATLPRILLGSVGGVFADRSNRRQLIVIINVVSAIVYLPLLLVRSSDLVWLIYIVLFLGAALNQFASPAERAMLPILVGKDRLVQANALFTVSGSMVSLLGPPLGGLLLGVSGFATVVIINVVSFALAAALIGMIQTGDRLHTQNGSNINVRLAPSSTAWRDWLDGLHLIRQRKILRVLFTVSAIAMIEEGIYNAIWVVWVSSVLGATSFQLGLLGSALGLGILLGGGGFARLGNRLSTGVVGISVILMGGFLAATVSFPILWLALALTVLRGIVVVGFFDGTTTLIQQRVEDVYIGRTIGTFSTVKAVMQLLGTAAAIAGTDLIGATFMLNVASAFCLLAGVVALVLSDGSGSDRLGNSRVAKN